MTERVGQRDYRQRDIEIEGETETKTERGDGAGGIERQTDRQRHNETQREGQRQGQDPLVLYSSVRRYCMRTLKLPRQDDPREDPLGLVLHCKYASVL